MVKQNGSPLVLPPHLAASKSIALPTPKRLEFDYEEAIKGMRVAKGRVVIVPFTGSFKSVGGLDLMQGAVDAPGTIDNLWYGFVLKCGTPTLRDGTPVEDKDFPLPPYTLVEHSCIRPFVGRGGYAVINGAEITNHWLQGEYPVWFPKEYSQ